MLLLGIKKKDWKKTMDNELREWFVSTPIFETVRVKAKDRAEAIREARKKLNAPGTFVDFTSLRPSVTLVVKKPTGRKSRLW